MNVPGVISATVSIDKIGWWHSYGLSKSEQAYYEAKVGKLERAKDAGIMNKQFKGGWSVQIPRCHEFQAVILNYLQQRNIPTNRVDVAFDLKFTSDAAKQAALYQLRQHLVITNAPNAQRQYYDNGTFALKDWSRLLDSDGEPIGTKKRVPARSGIIYVKPNNTLRIELRFKSKASVERNLPPLDSLLGTNPKDIFKQHFRWKTYRPRLLASAICQQQAKAERDWLLKGYRYKALTGIWDRLLTTTSPRINRMTKVDPLHLDAPFEWA